MKIFFINFGNIYTGKNDRVKVSEEFVESELKNFTGSMYNDGDYVSLNETYISFDGNLEQGKMIKYFNK